MMRTLKWHCPRTREQQLLPPNPPSMDYCLRIYRGPPTSLLPPNPLAAHCLRTPLPAYCIRVRLRTHTKLLLPPNSIGSGHICPSDTAASFKKMRAGLAAPPSLASIPRHDGHDWDSFSNDLPPTTNRPVRNQSLVFLSNRPMQ